MHGVGGLYCNFLFWNYKTSETFEIENIRNLSPKYIFELKIKKTDNLAYNGGVAFWAGEYIVGDTWSKVTAALVNVGSYLAFICTTW
jgi:hypothetical protein